MSSATTDAVFSGSCTALVTPFDDGQLDKNAFCKLVEWQIENGTDALIPVGTTGESPTLSHEEHDVVVELCIKQAAGRVPIIAGAGSNSTAEAVRLAKHAAEADADAVLIVSPYYNKPTQEGIHDHYAEVAKQTGFPLVIYNIPGRTASNIAPETVARLAELPEIVGIKEACGDLDQIAHVVALSPDSFRVLSGDDALTLPLLSVGGHGCISTTGNLVPEQMVALDRAWRAGNTAEALQLHQKMMPLFDILFCETNPIPIKAALALMGWTSDEIRLPLTPLTPSNRDRLEGVLKEVGVLT